MKNNHHQKSINPKEARRPTSPRERAKKSLCAGKPVACADKRQKRDNDNDDKTTMTITRNSRTAHRASRVTKRKKGSRAQFSRVVSPPRPVFAVAPRARQTGAKGGK